MFRITATCKETAARTSVLSLPHGDLELPAFMPVGTQAAVKGLAPEVLERLGFQIILSNTYHLMLRPGEDLIREMGGLHKFMKWNGNILTDSGGFQVFSLARLRKITGEGVVFQSHLDGSRHLLTPERAVRIQEALGSDIQMVLDVCTEPGISHDAAKAAVETTHLWAKRALEERAACDPAYGGLLFGIVQGNFFKDLREQSAVATVDLDFPGYAIGGLSVGEPPEVFREMLFHTAVFLPEQKPRYVMGIGTPDYIFDAVEAGIDMFDCVFPTRVARNGFLFHKDGRINIRNEKYAREPKPVDPESPIAAYSLGYLRHLFKAGEMLGPMLATEHNLWFLQTLMRRIRTAINEGTFRDLKNDFLSRYSGSRKGRE